jgi:hypothetical protein
MTEHGDIPSVDDALLTSSVPHNGSTDNEGGAGAPASPPQTAQNARVQQLIREKAAADALAARSAAEAAVLRGNGQAPGRPQDYRAPEDYTRAVAEQAVREASAGMLARQAAQAQELAARAAQDAWAEATAGFRQKVPDFDAVAHNPNLAITPIMADAIRESGRGAEIAYYLGKNPAEAAQIAGLAPVSQATAVARLEGKLAAGTSSMSRAPEPVSTLSGRGGSQAKPLEDMDFEEYRRARGF